MRRVHTILAIAAMMSAGSFPSTNANPTPYKLNAGMGTNPFFMPSKSQRVKNKLSRIRRGVK